MKQRYVFCLHKINIDIRISNNGRNTSNLDSNLLDNLGDICIELKIIYKQEYKMKKIIITVVLIATTLFGFSNQLKSQNQAFKSNNGYVVKRITFKNSNLKMAGNLYLPAKMDEAKKYAAIVCTHPGGGVKEQTSGLYAQKLAEQGYVTLAFDASHQGESEGEPRFLEDPTQRVEDIRCAVDYLTTLTFVDAQRIGALGICAGGGYTLSAAQTEHRIKAVAGVSIVDIGLTFREGWDGKTPVSEQIKLLEMIAKQRTAEANGAKPILGNYVPETVDSNTIPDMREAHDYYRTPRGQHINSTNQVLFISFDKVIAFSAFNQLGTLLTQPVLLVAGSNAGSRWQSELAYNMAKSTKELFIVDGATHMDLYDIPKYVTQAVSKLKEFYGKNL